MPGWQVPDIVAGCAVAGPAVIGVMRAEASIGGRWQRHDGGDEVMVLMTGECAVWCAGRTAARRSIMPSAAMCW